MNAGWVKIHRDIKSHWIYDNPEHFRAWMDLLLSVNHDSVRTSYGGQVIDVAAGSMITSVQELTELWGWSSKSRTKRFLDLLVSDGMVELERNSKNDPRGTVLTIVNWEFYQGMENSKRTVNGTVKEQQENSKRPDTILNIKNDKNDKKEDNPLYPPLKNDSISEKQFSPIVESAVRDWLEYKKERRDAYKPTGLKNLLTQIENRCKELTDGQVAFAIAESMARNYKGIIWDLAQQKQGNPPHDGGARNIYAELEEEARRQEFESMVTSNDQS